MMLYVAVLIAAYFGLLVVLAVATRPYRAQLAHVANELIRDYPNSESIRRLCDFYVGTAYSMRIAPIRFLAYLAALIKPASYWIKESDDLKQQEPDFFNDSRIKVLIDAHSASTFAASPIFGALAYGARWAFIIKGVIHLRNQGREDGDALTGLVELHSA